ncbi:MAG: hypothetical protein COB38_02295 [Gammaproteobacteria bacterium]|nr:MAG: hypothetical protein COB38_02295 [Gammaproteobacteria bacterium]
MMKYLLAIITMVLVSNTNAKDVQYDMRVDGITCPFCVATSAKALKKIDGVKSVGSDLEKGIIKVCADEKVIFKDEELKKMFIDKGFTFKGMSKKEQCESV